MKQLWRILNKGEVIREGDLVDMCSNPMHDDPKWQNVNVKNVGTKAPDPQFRAHRIYKRKVSL